MTGSQGLSMVLGAGPVGRALVDRLVDGGSGKVRVASRSGQAEVSDGVEVVAADVSDPDQAVRACAGADVVYGCVGLDYTGWPERYGPATSTGPGSPSPLSASDRWPAWPEASRPRWSVTPIWPTRSPRCPTSPGRW